MFSCCKTGSSVPYFTEGGIDIDAVLDWEHKAYDKCGVRRTSKGRQVIEYPKAEKKEPRDDLVPLLVVILCDTIEEHKRETSPLEVERYLSSPVTKTLKKAIMAMEKKAVEKNMIRNKLARERNPGDLAWCLVVQFLENTFSSCPLFPQKNQANLVSIWKLYYWHTSPDTEVPSDDWLHRVREWFETPRKTQYLKQLIYLMHQINADFPSRYGTLRRIFKACKECSEDGTDFEKIAHFCELMEHKLFNADTASYYRSAGYIDGSLEDICGWGGEFYQQCAEARRQCFFTCVAHYDAIFDNQAFEEEATTITSVLQPSQIQEAPKPESSSESPQLVSVTPCAAAALSAVASLVVDIYAVRNQRRPTPEPPSTEMFVQIGNSADFETVPSEVSNQQLTDKTSKTVMQGPSPLTSQKSSGPSDTTRHDDSKSSSQKATSHSGGTNDNVGSKGGEEKKGQSHAGSRSMHDSSLTGGTTSGSAPMNSTLHSGASLGKSPGLPKAQSSTHSQSPQGFHRRESQVRSYQGSRVSDHSVAVSQEVIEIINDTDVRSRATDTTALRNADKIRQLANCLKKSEDRFVQSENAQRQLADACKELERRLDGKPAGQDPQGQRSDLGLRQSQLSQNTHQLLDLENEVISLRRENRELADDISGVRREMKRERVEGDRILQATHKEVTVLRGVMKSIGEAMEGFQEEMVAMRDKGRVTDSDMENAMLREELSRVRHDSDMLRTQLQEMQENMLKMERNIRTHGYEHATPKRSYPTPSHPADTYTSSSSSSSAGYLSVPTYANRLIADDTVLNAKLASLQYQLS